MSELKKCCQASNNLKCLIVDENYGWNQMEINVQFGKTALDDFLTLSTPKGPFVSMSHVN